MKQTSQRSLLFRQNMNRMEAEWVHFLDGYRKALIEFDMKKFGDDWHTAEDIVEEIFVNIVREPRITALRPQDSFRHVLINMCMQKREAGGSRVTYFCEFCLRQLRMVTPKRRLKSNSSGCHPNVVDVFDSEMANLCKITRVGQRSSR